MVQDRISRGPNRRYQSKQVNSPLFKFMAPDQVLSFLVSRPKFLKGRHSFGWTEQVLYVEFHSVTKSWVSRSYQRWYFHSTWSSRRNTLFAKSWSKQMEWGADVTIKSWVPWTLTIARESGGVGGEGGHLTVSKGAASVGGGPVKLGVLPLDWPTPCIVLKTPYRPATWDL